MKVDRGAFLARLREVRAYRRRRRAAAPESRDPISFLVTDKNAKTCEDLFRMTPGEVKAYLPLKVLRNGKTIRYLAVPKQIERFLETLPDA